MPEMIVVRFVWFKVDGADAMLPVRSTETETRVYLPWYREWKQLALHPLPAGDDLVLRLNLTKHGPAAR